MRITSGMILTALGLLACSNPEEPEASLPTLLVANPTCDTSACQTIYIRAFVWAFTIPQNPIGIKLVGQVDGPTACFQFPATWTVTIQEVDSDGVRVGEPYTYTWTPDDPDGIFLTALPSVAGFPLAATETFVPADASGWNLTFSKDPVGGFPFTAHLAPAAACEPATIVE